ncbi:MAG: phosphonate C-P lyase system protein PhnH [Ktedonobacteraceae bacterium]
MSLTSPAIVRFDAVRDTQKVFRVLLDALSRPGKFYELPQVGFVFGSARSSAFDPFQALGAVLATLLDHEVTFCLLGQDDVVRDLSTQLASLTSSRSASRDKANYVVTLQAPQKSLLSQLNTGNLLYPDTSTTLLCLVPDLAPGSRAEQSGTLLALAGPGVAEGQTIWVADTDATFFDALSTVNAHYPLGIDVILLTPAGRVAGLPRSTQSTILAG